MAATQQSKPYDPSEVEGIKQMLEAEAREGKPVSFDVKVDGMTRILKTSNVQRFDELYNFINENTRELVISIYPDATNRKEWYKYSFGQSGDNNEKGLNGIEVEQKVKESMQLFEERHAARMTEEKLKQAQTDLKEAEEYISILTAQLEDAKVKPNHFGKIDLPEFAGQAITSIAKHYPKVLDDVPVLNGIAKVIRRDSKQQSEQLQSSFQGDVSFRAKQPKTALSPEAQAYENSVRELMSFIDERFDGYQRRLLGLLITKLGDDPSQLTPVAELIGLDVAAIKAGFDAEQQEETED